MSQNGMMLGEQERSLDGVGGEVVCSGHGKYSAGGMERLLYDVKGCRVVHVSALKRKAVPPQLVRKVGCHHLFHRCY